MATSPIIEADEKTVGRAWNVAYFAGVDIGGTKIAVGIGNTEGAILCEMRFPTDEVPRGEDGLDRIAEAVKSLCTQNGGSGPQIRLADVAAVGIGSPGPLDRGTLLKTANLPGWEGINLASGLQTRLGIPCRVENDATAAGMGEWMFGAGRGTSHMAYVTVSTGVGSGIIVNSQLYSGGRGNAGELGHIVLIPDGPVCHCGQRGCLETLASGTALARIAHERRNESPYLQRQDGIDAPTVFLGVEAGDAVCQAIIQDMTRYLGQGLSFLVNLLNPERIVLGGGVMANGDMLLPLIQQRTQEYSMPALYRTTEIVLAGLGQDSGLVGALAVALVART